MLSRIWRAIPVLLVVLLTGFTYPGGNVQFGGEIPWPLSNQRAVSESTSQGLWDLQSHDTRKLFNVEIVTDHESGYDWIRVAEIDPENYTVMSWGEGIFRSGAFTRTQWQSSFFDVTTQPGAKSDKYGRYITMFPNGDINEPPYLLRLVEVKTAVGHVLGLSVIHYIDYRYDHMLGQKILDQPLRCDERAGEQLSCFID
jgi:hypothetical protein